MNQGIIAGLEKNNKMTQKSPTPLSLYLSDLDHDDFVEDPAQRSAVELTQDLYQRMQADTSPKQGFIASLFGSKPENIPGLYFWGSTGRGKTYLIDQFYQCLDFEDKHRVHFHNFMREIHEQLRLLPKSPDPLAMVAKRFSQQNRILCLDEFHVHDIGDAMIMAGLLEALISQGVTIVATSNIPIADLYKNGLQRERFLPAIELLKSHTREFNIGDGTDYRFAKIEENDVYFITRDPAEGDNWLNERFESIILCQPKRDRQLELNHRVIQYRALADDVIWFDFDAICNTPRSAHDYIDIAKTCHTVMLGNIPIFTPASDSVAKRFIHLIDALYDHHVKLIATTAAKPEKLYNGERLAFAFERTVSRLIEMGNQTYLASPHVIERQRQVYAAN